MENGHTLEQLIIDRMNRLEDKLDGVRTVDIPNLRTDVALMIQDNKPSSKLHSTIGAALAVVISMAISRFKH